LAQLPIVMSLHGGKVSTARNISGVEKERRERSTTNNERNKMSNARNVAGAETQVLVEG
jgi:hypothetical protein